MHGRDPRQTSDAFGAAAVQVGPGALALAVTMNKRLGMPHADVATVLQDGLGLHVNRSTVCRAVARVARRGEATWHARRHAARRSLVNAMDEPGWNVAAQLRWLWVVVSEQVTFCDILPGRSFTQAASLLGAEYDGWLTHDGWAVYYKFLKAGHQTCLAQYANFQNMPIPALMSASKLWRGGRTAGLRTQSVFSLAARREDVGTWRDGERRDGGEIPSPEGEGLWVD